MVQNSGSMLDSGIMKRFHVCVLVEEERNTRISYRVAPFMKCEKAAFPMPLFPVLYASKGRSVFMLYHFHRMELAHSRRGGL